ncbi:uncharacterized protein A1O5_02504 [Cladophialophora psammophila CBS 110553]|uniref:Uncharacterized protein n=1 Tax=Cladophialophora psammophila CBS 110553 TaxID=1182543 RepID=W9XVB9_9EURO|nr:uncharacterized protein A1O5_02504 [Cladophialophora psammophila CBS 110553]EXJ74209.1 hypothetical protein A1O5_02504 [Cladophialophora psammophila CBS 110553]
MTDHLANMGGCDWKDPPQAVVATDDDHSEEWSRVETRSLDDDVLLAVRDTNGNDKSDGGSEESYDNEPPNYADSADRDLLRQCFPAGTATLPDPSSQASLSFRTQPCEDIRVNEPEQPVNEPEQPVNEPEQPVNEPEQPVNEPEQPVNESEQPTGLQARTEPRLARDDERNLKRKASTELERTPSKSTEEVRRRGG